ncbi:MAG: tetratricopeptide repeat protein, partial [Myxococcales bacterium]|nr:tetratricopeptide repeat protein [Myxococcales bacterium]
MLGLGACTRVTTPPPEPPAAPLDVAQAQAELDGAIEALARAEADGTLSPAECEQVTAAFRAAYQEGRPETANALFDAGVVWERCGAPQKAQQAYQDAIAARAEHCGAHNNLGVLQWKAGERQAALASFQRAVAADGRSAAARNNLAAALRERYLADGSTAAFEQAESALRNALAVDSDNATSLESLARLYYDRGKDRGKSGERSYLLLARLVVTQGTRVLEAQGRPSAELANLHGLLLMEDDDQVAALRAFKEATTIDPDHADAHLNIAMIALRFRDYATARTSLERALRDRRYQDDVTALLGLGVAQRGQRRYDDAEKTLVRAREVDQGDPRALYNLGILYHEHIAPTRSQVVDEAKGEARFDAQPYLDAKGYFRRFAEAAKDRYPEQVADARLRMASIDQLLQDIEDLEDLEAEQARLEALMKKQQQEERQ